MSQFRFHKTTRFAFRVSRAVATPILLRVRCTLRLTCAATPGQDTDWRRQAVCAAFPSLLSLLAIGTLGLLAGSLAARAQTTNVPHDVTLRFQTPDVAHPNSGALLQSMWSANDPAGWTIQYDLTTAWNTSRKFGSFTDIRTPKINLGLFSIPAIDYGEWGAGGQLFTKAKDTGLRFKAVASGGSVSVDYPVHVHLDTPRFIAPGATFMVHVTYQGDSAAKVSTLSPQAYASIGLMLNAQLYVNGRLEIANHDLFNTDIIDWCDRNDPDSPKYSSASTGSSNKGFHVDTVLFNTNALVSAAATKASYTYPQDSPAPSIKASLNFPIINTLGQPGSSVNYQSGSGGTSTNTSYEYTTGIPTPAEVTANPNATYARAQDNVINVTADFTNILTNALDLPPLNYTVPMGKAADITFGLLDLKAILGLGFLQEFAFVPKPRIRLMVGDAGAQTAEYEIDPVNGVDIPVQMPTLPPGADPNASVSVKVAPLVSMPNDFISNTYLNFNGGLFFRPIYLEVKGSGRIGSFSFDPLDLHVGVDIPYPIYKTSFAIPFGAQTGDAFYVTTHTPPLASLASIYPSLLYVNENERSGGYGVGVSADLLALFADTTIVPPNDFAGGWFGTLNSGGGSATALTYSTQAYWDKVDDLAEMQVYPIGQTYQAAEWGLNYRQSNTWVDLTPGIHHVYAANKASSGGSIFGPRITGLPLPVAYPKPTLEMLGARCTLATPGANPEFIAAHGLIYKPYTLVPYGVGGRNKNAVGPILAGGSGFTLLAINHAPFNDSNAPNDPNLVAPWSVGGFSRIKFDGKLLTPDLDSVYSNVNPTGNGTAYPLTSGMIPASMIAKAGLHTVQISNPAVGGKGGDSNIIVLHVVNPAPVIDDVGAVQQNPVQGANVDIMSHVITTGSPDTRLKITGSGLTPDSVVYWRDTAHPLVTEFVNGFLMYATLPAAQITLPQANHTLYVVNPRSTTSGQPVDGGSDSTTHLHLYAATPHVTSLEVDGTPINALYLNSPNDVTVTIRGDHFWPGVTADWRHTLNVSFVDEQTLIATIHASDLSSLGSGLGTDAFEVRSRDYDENKQISPPYNLRVVYAPPVLASLGTSPAVLPPAVQVGAAAPTLALTGGLFYPGSRVTVGGKDCAVTFVDTMHLQAVVPVGVVGAIGSYPVVVTNPSSPDDADGTPVGDGGVSNAMPFQALKYAPQAQLKMTATLTRVNSGTVQAQITLTNTGTADANGLVLQSAGLGSTAGSGTLPGALAVGQSVTLPISFAVPASAKGTIQTLKLTGTMQTSGQAASFNSSVRVQIP